MNRKLGGAWPEVGGKLIHVIGTCTLVNIRGNTKIECRGFQNPYKYNFVSSVFL